MTDALDNLSIKVSRRSAIRLAFVASARSMARLFGTERGLIDAGARRRPP